MRGPAACSWHRDSAKGMAPRIWRSKVVMMRWVTLTLGLVMAVMGAMLASSSHPTAVTQWSGGILGTVGVIVVIVSLYFEVRRR